jgi:hypothetical protein
METVNPAVLAAVVTTAVTVALVLARVVEHLVLHLIKRKDVVDTDRTSILTLDENQKLSDCRAFCVKSYEILSQHDSDGVPLVYFPRSYSEIYKGMAELQHKMVEKMAEMTMEQRRLVDILERLERRLDNAT